MGSKRIDNLAPIQMTNIKSIEQSNVLYRQNEIKQKDIRHENDLVEQNRIKAQRIDTEQKRIEMNRRMNRAGQNVDRMA